MMEMVLTSSILILLLILLRQALRGRIRPSVQYTLWLLAAARLLIPGTLFAAPVSVAGAAEELQTSVLLLETSPGRSRPDAPDLPADGPAASFAARPADGPSVPSVTEPPTVQADELLDRVWKTGIAITGGAMVVSNFIFYLRLRKNRKRLALPDALWSGNLPVYGTEALPSPCLFGLFRPAIYLNEAAMDAEHPEHILVHEYAHYRHGDHLWAVLRCVCLAIHWYNPLVWWAAALSRRDCELACDEAAIRRLGEDARIDYGQTLLRMVSKGRHPSTLLRTATTMTTGKHAMKERIALIIQQPRMRKATAVAVALLACLLVVCAFGGKADEPTEPGGDVPAAVYLSEILSSQPYSEPITDAEIVSRLWELYQGFEFTGTTEELTQDNIWSVTASFQDEAGNEMAHFTIFEGGLCWLEDDYETFHILRDGQAIYEAFRDCYRTELRDESFLASLPEIPAPGQEAAKENARLIVEQIQQGVDPSQWLPLMSYMDWQVLAQAAVEAGLDEGDGSGALVDIIGIICQYIAQQGGAMTMAEYLYLLSATEGLDGAPAEGYSFMIYRMYAMNPRQFAYVVLEMLPETQRNEALYLFCFEWDYHRISDSPEFPTREEAIAQLEADLEAGIIATPSETTLRSEGSTFQFRLLNAFGIYALTYTSSDTGVAVVDDSGGVTAVGPGEAVITLHYEGAGGPLDFECRVLCTWEPGAQPVDAVAAREASARLYSDEVDAWREWFQGYMDAVPAAPAGEITYDSTNVASLYDAVSAYLYPYAKEYFGTDFARNCYDYEMQLAFGVPNRLTQPQLDISYQVEVFAAFTLPDGELYGEKIVSRELKTTLTVTDAPDPMQPLINEWQRSFAGFVLEIPAAPDQELVYNDMAEGGLYYAVMERLEAYAQDYVDTYGNKDYDTRFSHIALEAGIPASADYGEQITVYYRIECVQDRTYEGRTYTLATQPGDHLATTFTVYDRTNFMAQLMADGVSGNLPAQE